MELKYVGPPSLNKTLELLCNKYSDDYVRKNVFIVVGKSTYIGFNAGLKKRFIFLI